MSDLWFGSTNKGKISEIKTLIAKYLPTWTLRDLGEIKGYSQPPENGKTFLENARIKARSLRAMRPEAWSFAEDSGLEVEGLGGLPGIHSARYAGPKASDSENVSKILKMMQLKNAQTRAARFHCQIVAFSPDGSDHILDGTMSGHIASKPAGLLGFGYDPIFIADGQTQTLAELGPGVKNQNSHRAKAFEKLAQIILEAASTR